MSVILSISTDLHNIILFFYCWVLGYFIGLSQVTKIYNELDETMENDFIETLKSIGKH